VGERDRTKAASKTDRQAEVEALVASLSDEEVMLIRLRDELYDGRWDAMLADLNDRLHGRPYVFRLANRIQDDIKRIEKLHRFERQHGVNLADYL